MIVVVQSIGQIGNRLEQFSHLIAFARDHGVTIANPAFSLYSEFFEHTHRDLWCRHPSQSASWVRKGLQRLCYYGLRLAAGLGLLRFVPGSVWIEAHWTSGAYDLANPQFIQLARAKKFVFLTGTWEHRYWKNYEAHIPAIQEHFQLTPELRDRIARHLAPQRRSDEVLVGIHIRQGDFASHQGGAYFFDAAAYAGVMRQVAKLFPEKPVVFLVCSNVPQETGSFPGLRVFFGLGDFVCDLYSLAACDYIIGPEISSFSGWASLMGQKPRYGLSDPARTIALADFVICKGLE